MRRLALLIALLAAGPAALAQVPADTLRADTVAVAPPEPAGPDPEANEPDAGDPGSVDDGTQEDLGRLRVSPRLAPSALYSGNRGFGIGGGVAIANLGWRGSEIGVDLRAQQRYLSGGLTVYTGDPASAPVFGLFSVGASTTNRRQFYGVGPFTSGNSPLFLSHSDLEAEARLGVYPLGNTALLVQPGVRYLADRTGGVRDDSPVTLDSLTLPSRAAVEPTLGETRTGLSVGVEVAHDLRDWPSYPRSGTLVSVEARRFFALDASELTFNRYTLQAAGYLPLHGRTTLIGSVTGILTRQGDADGDGAADAVPYFYLPTLDDRVAVAYRQDRLSARDVMAVGLGVRLPLADFIGYFGVDALVVGYLGNAYDDLFRQFSPRVSFSQNAPADSDGRAALRPALGIGIGVVDLDKERVIVGALVGIGAGGVTLAAIRIAYDLRDSRPLFR